jgi:hypothetical protein
MSSLANRIQPARGDSIHARLFVAQFLVTMREPPEVMPDDPRIDLVGLY